MNRAVTDAQVAFVEEFLREGCVVDAHGHWRPFVRDGWNDRRECHHTVSAVDVAFHDAFHARFGGRRAEKMYGASPVAKAMKILSEIADDGVLVRRRVRLSGLPAGFPRHVLSYELRDAPPCTHCPWGHRDVSRDAR